MKSFTIFSSIYGYNIFSFSISLTIFCKLLALYLQIKFIAQVEIILLYLAFNTDDKSLFSSVLKSFFWDIFSKSLNSLDLLSGLG